MPSVLRLAGCALLSALFGFGETSPKNVVLASVGIFMDFESAPNAAALAAMEVEVARLLKASGVILDWRLIRQNRGDERFAGLVVLKFRGACRAEARPLPAPDFGTLGEVKALAFTRVAQGRVLPFSEVECDQVRRSLAYLRPSATTRERQNALGMAMGRVVAHELYHILAKTTAHAAKGLAKASQSLEDLVTLPELKF